MRISIGLSVLLNRNFSGIGKYTFYITKHLLIQLYTLKNIHFEGLIFFKRVKIERFLEKLQKNLEGKGGKYLLKYARRESILRKYLLYSLRYSTRFIKTNLYLEPNFVPLSYSAEKIISFVHDLSFFYPAFHPLYRVENMSYGFMKKTAKSDIILVPSNFIKDEICNKFPWLEEKIRVIYHGIDHSIFKPFHSQNIEKRYILFVGNIEPRKNVINLLKAYSFLPDTYKKNHPLIIVSRDGWKNEEVFRFISENNLWNSVFIRNDIHTDEELANMYRKALLLVYPSLYEGFGFPPLEAMACGCPVLVSNKGSLPEVCDKYAIYVNPYDINDIFEKLKFALEYPNILEELSKQAVNYVRKFSWEKSAQEHLKLFLELLNYLL